MAMIRLFLVDDHAVLREGLRLMLSSHTYLQVVGEAGSSEELLARLPHTPADVVLLDLCLPDLSGAEITRQLADQYPAAQVLVLSSTYAPDQVRELFAAGARGYALKSGGMAELVHGIRTVAEGRRFLCTGLGLAALEQVAQCQTKDRAISAVPTVWPLRALTERELEVLRLLAEGCSNQEMADRLFTSKRTVETHRQNLIAKSQAKNTAALVKLATSQGWLH
jgi:DNA-binding NarL/FixJ family response regulator